MSAALLTATAQAQGNAQEPCPGGGYDPTPVEVAVTAVPIVVTSTTADYFVLYVKHDVDGTEVELPVLVKLGEAGTTTLAENVEALPVERYRVEKYQVADPADVDGDCTDDITELADLRAKNPVNPATAVELTDGAVTIPDRETFKTLAHRETFLKLFLFGMNTDRPGIYFMNTKTHKIHQFFLDAVGLESSRPKGYMDYDSKLVAPDGSLGVYRYAIDGLGFSRGAIVYTVLAASMPLLNDNLVLYVPNVTLPHIQSDLSLYRASRIPLVFDEDIYPRNRLPGAQSGGRLWSAARPGAGRPAPPARHCALRSPA